MADQEEPALPPLPAAAPAAPNPAAPAPVVEPLDVPARALPAAWRAVKQFC